MDQQQYEMQQSTGVKGIAWL